jgi:hypothetical protein
MGSRGPVPKRSTTRAGHRAKGDKPETIESHAICSVPDPDPAWDLAALAWYESLPKSGQSRYYEPSDWQVAKITASMLSKLLSADRPSAELFKAVDAAMDKLGVTEGARRRMRIEVNRPGQDAEGDPKVVEAAKKAVTERYLKLAKG